MTSDRQYVLFGVVVIGALWATSQNLRERVTIISQEVGEHVATQSGCRGDAPGPTNSLPMVTS